MSIYFEPENACVLVIDLQKAIFPGEVWAVEDYDQVLENAQISIESCREAGIPVIYAVYQLEPTGVDKIKHEPVDNNGRPLHSVKGDEDAEICDKVKPEEDDIVFTKQKFTAWYGSRLETILNNLGVNHIIILGVWTEACLETTVWDAIWKDYRVTLVKDACGSGTNDIHKVAVLDMANWLYGGSVIKANDLARALQGYDYHAWHFTKPAEFLYTLNTVDELYESI